MNEIQNNLLDYCRQQGRQELLTQWDTERNGPLTPGDVSYGSHRRIWWKCEKGHSWLSVVYSRVGGKTGCPYCAGKKPQPNRLTLAEKNPEIAAQWHPEKNLPLTPDKVRSRDDRKVWWQCEKGHSWQAQIRARVAGTGCPVCSNRRIIPGINDLATRYPELVEQWDQEKNGPLTPDQSVPGKRLKVWWKCEKGHSWKATIESRSAGRGCPVCAGKQVVTGDNDLASAFPEIAAQWHPEKNGSLAPGDVTPCSNRRVWWLCDKGHDYESIVAHRTRSLTGCPYCSGKKVLPGFNDLATCRPEVAEQWHPTLNGTLTPAMVTVGSHRKVWWLCPDGHVWKAVIHSRAASQRCGCPVCAGVVRKNDFSRYVEFADRI